MCANYVICQTHLYYAATEKETCTSNYYNIIKKKKFKLMHNDYKYL